MDKPVVYDKPFLSYPQQVERLKTKYRLDIQNDAFALHALSTISYYDLINGYQECMMVNGVFKPNVSMEYLYMFYLFDKSFQNIVFKYSLFIENSFKTSLAYILGKNFGVSINEYLDNKNFLYSYKGKVFLYKVKEEIIKGFTKYDKQNHPYYTQQPTKHYMENHNHLPPWILMKNVSFGNSINLYKLLKSTDKVEVTSLFFSASEIRDDEKIQLLTSALDFIRNYRNQIAHNLKFVTYKNHKFRLPTYITKKVINNSIITDNKKDFNDVYSCLLAIYMLLRSSLIKTKFLYDISNVLTDIPSTHPLYTVQNQIIKDYIAITGLPANFREIIALLTPHKI